MRKFTITTAIVMTVLWFGLTSLLNSVKADEYSEAVIGHVIQSTVNGVNVDSSKLLEQELEKLAHKFAIESISILQAYLPAILDSVSAQLRLVADNQYKCKLLEDTKIQDDCL